MVRYIIVSLLYQGHGSITIHGEASWRAQPSQRQTVYVSTAEGTRILS